MPGSIGVAISTRNRRTKAVECVNAWKAALPEGATLVVVDDCSDEPFPNIPDVHVVHNEHRMGVAMTKNRCLSALMDAGAQHLFLADDDVWPIAYRWWEPYTQSPSPHLSYQWVRTGKSPANKWVKEWEDEQHWGIKFPRGVLLYVERHIVDRVGGMDPAYGYWGGEHVAWSQTIHDFGFTEHPFMDVKGSDELWYARDKHDGNTTNSTVHISDRRKMSDAVAKLWEKPRQYTPYREDDGLRDYQLGPELSPIMSGTLAHVLTLKPDGVALEFGVGEGHSLSRIARVMPSYGFDTWLGLPERWRDGFDAGMFACKKPAIPRATLVEGLVQDTTKEFLFEEHHIGLIHFDLDLYSSTAAVLENIVSRDLVDHVFHPGLFVVFDEWHGYPHDGVTGPEDHEQKAWREFADRTGMAWSVIGHGPEQWAIRITGRCK